MTGHADAPSPQRPRGLFKQTLDEARQGVVGNAAWGLIVIAAITGSAFLKGTVPAVVFLIAVILALAFGGFATSATRQTAIRLEAERDEARDRADRVNAELARERHESADRLSQLRAEHEAEIRELREHIATATGGQAAISIRWQGVIRQITALREAHASDRPVPTSEEHQLLVALAEDFVRHADGDTVAEEIAARWRETRGSSAEFVSALAVLGARAVSIGTQEALAPRPEFE